MNNIFQKNINALAQKNEALAKKLLTYIPTEIPELKQENGAYNLFYKNLYLHNPQNPLGEAQEIFAMAENSPIAIHLVYGLGLGYLFQVASLKSQGTVILYEPDLNIMKIAFTLVDFSNDILKRNVFITDNLDQVGNYIYTRSNTKNTPLLLTTTAYRELNSDDFIKIVEELQRIVGMFGLDLKYTKQRFYGLTLGLINNIPNLLSEIPFAELKNRCVGKTAVVVSAGPSLDRDIEVLKKYRDKYILFVVGTAAKTVFAHGIKPDFVCIIESYDASKQLAGLDLSDVNFITEPTTNKNLRNFKFKQTYSHVAANLPVNALWNEIADIDLQEYWSKGTVSYTSLNCARILGCSKIILVGQDLAYIEGQCYSKDSAYKDLECRFNKEFNSWEIVARDFEHYAQSLSNSPDAEIRKQVAIERLKNLNSALYYVKGINGDMIPTESVYAAFIKPLSEYTQHFNDREYINASLVGAQIDGFKNMALEDALKNSETIEERDFSVDYKYDVEAIKQKLIKQKSSLAEACKMLDVGLRQSNSLKNDLNRARSVNADILKSLKKISMNYLDLSSNFADKNKIYDFITTSVKLDLDYEMKMMREFTFESVSNINEKLFEYYDVALKRVNRVDTNLAKVIEEL